MTIGEYLRKVREEKIGADPSFSIRQVGDRAGLKPGYLSRIERGLEKPSDATITALAGVLGEDLDVLLAIDGRVSKRLRELIIQRPKMFKAAIEELAKLADIPEDEILQGVRGIREIRDGKW